jgi:siroheme synthase-like protein
MTPDLPPAYPVNLHLAGRLAVVVGGGPVAARKARGLLACGARVRVVAPSICRQILSSNADKVTEPFHEDHVEGAFLVVAATGVRAVDERVAAVAAERRTPVLVAGRPELSDFTLPAVGDKGPVRVTVSTGGASPALSALLRDRIMETVSEAEVAAARLAGELRLAVKQALPPGPERRALLRRLGSRELIELLATKGRVATEMTISSWLSEAKREARQAPGRAAGAPERTAEGGDGDDTTREDRDKPP